MLDITQEISNILVDKNEDDGRLRVTLVSRDPTNEPFYFELQPEIAAALAESLRGNVVGDVYGEHPDAE